MAPSAALQPSRVLFSLVAECQWEDVRSRCRSHPQDCNFRDGWNGYTPIHVAVERSAPEDVIRALIDASPKAVAVEASVHGSDNTYLPLHTACAAGASWEVLRLLVLAYPPATQHKGGHFFPDRTPLQILWGHYFGMGWMGFDVRPPSNKKLYRHLATLSTTASLKRLPSNNDHDIWLKISLLLDAAHRGTNAAESCCRLEPDDERLVLRAASALGLLTNHQHEDFAPIREGCPDDLQDMVERLLKDVLPNRPRRNRSAFLLAIADGLPCCTVHYLLSKDPDAVSTRDIITGLFPHSLAASIVGRGLDYLNLSFQLLLANPEVVAKDNFEYEREG